MFAACGPAGAFAFFARAAAPPRIYTLSLHDALPIWAPELETRLASRLGGTEPPADQVRRAELDVKAEFGGHLRLDLDRKSTRLNSSHGYISYAVFCLKKKKHYGHIKCCHLPWDVPRS